MIVIFLYFEPCQYVIGTYLYYLAIPAFFGIVFAQNNLVVELFAIYSGSRPGPDKDCKVDRHQESFTTMETSTARNPRPEPGPQEDRRAHRRLDIRLPMTFHRVGRAISNINISRSTTINVSTGGVYFETNRSDIEVGDRLALSFEIDPHDQRFPPNGAITTVAEVVRLEPLENQSVLNDMPLMRYGLAVNFRQPLKLSL